jgi:hypothetical protein
LARMVQSSRCTAGTLHLPFVKVAVPGISPAHLARRYETLRTHSWM